MDVWYVGQVQIDDKWEDATYPLEYWEALYELDVAERDLEEKGVKVLDSRIVKV